MVNEAARARGRIISARAVDLAMVMGTGFPPFRGGLLLADSIGLGSIVGRWSAAATGARAQRRLSLEHRAVKVSVGMATFGSIIAGRRTGRTSSSGGSSSR